MQKNILVILFLIFLMAGKLFAQANLDIEIPQEFLHQYKLDSKRYLDSTNPVAVLSGNAFNFWMAAKKGQRKGYDLDSLSDTYRNLRQKEYLKKCEFIKQNPDSYASLYFFNQQILNSPLFKPDSLFALYKNFSTNLKQTPLGEYVRQAIKRKDLLLIEKEMPLFSFITNTGNFVNLSSFRNERYVLICFWASWCGPCIRNIPFLKAIEETYKNKDLQIISISVDNSVSNWKAALKRYSMQWLQTCDLPLYTNERIRELYEIHYVPQYFLIDKQGKLVYQSMLAKDDDDYAELQITLTQVLNSK